MDIKIAPETLTALKANICVRFLYKLKFKLQSRHSQPVIAWADRRAQKVQRSISSALRREEEEQAPSFKTRLIMIELLTHHHTALLCFDLVTEEDNCTNPVQTEQPIHQISKRGKALIVWRSKRLDTRVAIQFMAKQSLDKGPLPYFTDALHPPFYDEGVRVEGPVDAGESGGGEEVDYMALPRKPKGVVEGRVTGELEVDEEESVQDVDEGKEKGSMESE